MKNHNCQDCDEKTVEGRAYVDGDTGLICVDLKRNDFPKDRHKDILVPYVCTTCGETTWKVKSQEEKNH